MTEHKTPTKRGPSNVIQVGLDDRLYKALLKKMSQEQVALGRSVPMTEVVRNAIGAYCGVDPAPVKWGGVEGPRRRASQNAAA